MDKPDYHVIAKGLAELICEKQKAYGDSFTKAESIIKVLYPGGIPEGKYKDALTVIRVLDKLFRIATADDSFKEDPWLDIAGYSLLSLGRIQLEMKETAALEGGSPSYTHLDLDNILGDKK